MSTKIIISRFLEGAELEQVTCDSTSEAKAELAARNAIATNRFRWGLSETNFITDDGSCLTIDEANLIRLACGVDEY